MSLLHVGLVDLFPILRCTAAKNFCSFALQIGRRVKITLRAELVLLERKYQTVTLFNTVKEISTNQ